MNEMNRKDLRRVRRTYQKAIRDKKITSMEDLFAFQSREGEIPADSWALVLEVPLDTFKRLRYFPYDMEVSMVKRLCEFLDLSYEVISELYYKTFDQHGISHSGGQDRSSAK